MGDQSCRHLKADGFEDIHFIGAMTNVIADENLHRKLKAKCRGPQYKRDRQIQFRLHKTIAAAQMGDWEAAADRAAKARDRRKAPAATVKADSGSLQQMRIYAELKVDHERA